MFIDHQVVVSNRRDSGEGGIRTRGAVLPARRFSKAVLSTTQPPLRITNLFFSLPVSLLNGRNRLESGRGYYAAPDYPRQVFPSGPACTKYMDPSCDSGPVRDKVMAGNVRIPANQDERKKPRQVEERARFTVDNDRRHAAERYVSWS